MRKRIAVALLLTVGALYERPVRSQTAPAVRIGVNQSAGTVSVRSAEPFTVQQNSTRTAKFRMVLTLDPNASCAVTKASLQYRTLVELDGEKLIVLPKSGKV